MNRILADTSTRSFLYDPRAGYDLAAGAYEDWHWFRFWLENEMPIVQKWSASVTPRTFLDAGSGTGLYRNILEKQAHRVFATDLSSKMLMIQLRKYPRAAVVQARIEALPFKNRAFDYVLCTRVLSHLEHLRPVFAEFARVIKPNGEVLISDVHPEHRYREMSIPTKVQRVSIETYKHPVADLKETLQDYGLELTRLKEFGLSDLIWKPPTKNFENIYDDPKRPIFYMCWLKRL